MHKYQIIRRNYKLRHRFLHETSSFCNRNFRLVTGTVALATVLAMGILGHHAAHGAVGFNIVAHHHKVDPSKMGYANTIMDPHHIHLSGHTRAMGWSYASLLGLKSHDGKPAVLPVDKITVNWGDNMEALWAHKLATTHPTDAAKTWASRIVYAYRHHRRDTKSIMVFINNADMSAKQMNRSIDYDGLCGKYHVHSCTRYKQVMGRINGPMLVSYGMTENSAGTNGNLNYSILDTLLRNAGENYVHSIPSQGDPLLSTGFYQFTSQAIRRDDSGKLGGVNTIDAFSHVHTSDSVITLKSNAAHNAAFELAAYNLMVTMRNMNDHDAGLLATKCSAEGLTQLVAISHHAPTGGWNAGKAWVHGGCSKPLSAYLHGDLKTYALKTASNMHAIMAHQIKKV